MATICKYRSIIWRHIFPFNPPALFSYSQAITDTLF
jgi:hypothetical protein